MLGGEHRRSNVYASCLEALKNQKPRVLKTKTRFADSFKAPKQEIIDREGIYRLKRKKPLMIHKYPV